MTTHSSPAQECTPLRIVSIGTSLDDGSDLVAATGLAIARAAGARVQLVHAAPAAAFPDVDLGFGPEMREQLTWREESLRAQVARLGIGGMELAGTAVRAGSPYRVLTQAAREEDAGLVVVGATRSGPLTAELLGSTAERVLRKAACPVLVVRGELPVPPRLVLAPVDLSPPSAESLRCGLEILAQIAHGSEIAVRVVYALSIVDLAAGRPQGLQGVSVEQERRHVEERLRQFVEEHRVEGPFRIETSVLPGEARFEILRDLEQHPADLVLLGTHGRGGFERLLLGSVAASVAAKAPCSVLLTPSAAARADSNS